MSQAAPGTVGFKYHRLDDLPRLAWGVQITRNLPVIEVFHGPRVEARAHGFFEGAWNGEYDAFDPTGAEGPIDAVARYAAELPADWATSALQVLDGALAAEPWLLGAAFSVADLNVAVMFQRPALAEVDRRPFAHVHGWLKRCRARPAFGRMVARGQAGE